MPPVPIGVVSRQDVVNCRFGGAQYLAQLIDRDNDGNYDTDTLDTAISDAEQEVFARLNTPVDMQQIIQSVARGQATWDDYRFLQMLVGRLVPPKLWRPGTQGLAKPQGLIDEENQVYADCERVRKKEASIGAPVAYPSEGQRSQQVDLDPQNNKMSLRAFTGTLI